MSATGTKLKLVELPQPQGMWTFSLWRSWTSVDPLRPFRPFRIPTPQHEAFMVAGLHLMAGQCVVSRTTAGPFQLFEPFGLHLDSLGARRIDAWLRQTR
jgi:hypothetical protein